MKDINIKDIIDLASEEIDNPESELKKVFDWHHERKIMLIKGTISIAVSLLIAIGLAYLKSEINFNSSWELSIILIGAISSIVYGIFQLVKAKRVGKKYLASITLLCQLKRIKPFINLYRRHLRGY